MIVTKRNSGPQRGPRVDCQEDVLQYVHDEPTASIRGTAERLGMKYHTVQRIVKEDGQHDYKNTKVQTLCN